MLRARLATAAVALPTLLWMVLWAPTWAFPGFAVVITAIGLSEYATMAFPKRRNSRLMVLGLGALTVVAVLWRGGMVGPGLSLVVAAGLIGTLLTRTDYKDGLHDFGLAIAGVLYIALLLPHFVLLHLIPEVGPRLVLFTIIVGMSGDTSGYFAGRSLGRHKLMPRISPGKTVEGGVGVLLGCSLAGAVCHYVLLPEFSLQKLALFALIMGVLGQLGDLCESMMKRTFGTKESGWIFPGHGGVLDRIDSLVFPVTFLYYSTTLSG